jgi:hypothetical protein
MQIDVGGLRGGGQGRNKSWRLTRLTRSFLDQVQCRLSARRHHRVRNRVWSAEWELDSEKLLDATLPTLPSWPPHSPTNADEFTSYCRALQALDRWHRPLVPSSEPDLLPKRDAHREADDRLVIDYCYGTAPNGILIPGCAWGHIPAERDDTLATDLQPLGEGDRPMLLRELLGATAFLPSSLATPETDGGSSGSRHLRIRYAVSRAPTNLPLREPNAPLTVGIAPLLEAEEDLAITLSVSGGWYSVRPTYPRERLTTVLSIALESQVELLFIPECAVDVEHLNWLKGEILNVGRSYYDANGKLPSLRYVLAGIVSPVTDPSDQGENFAVILDGEGKEICRQHKLFRWNLDENQIKRYGLDVDLNVTSQEIKENIAGGVDVTVVDFEDIGLF